MARKYTEKDREYHRHYHKTYYTKNKERILARNRKWAKDHPERMRAFTRKWQYKELGLDPNIAEKLVSEATQCAICHTTKSERSWDLDHCHVTGKIRGVLCAKCNKALGLFGHSTVLLQRAIEYAEILSNEPIL